MVTMAKLRVHNLSISLDGYAAGPDQGPDHPLGVGGERLHEWIFPEGGPAGRDEEMIRGGVDGIGATIMGRNMFGPVRGDWPDESWRGWWGDDPPFHHPVFVLTRHPRRPLEMAGGTVFHFVTDGVRSALDQAVAAAGGLDIRLGGGPATIRQFLQAGLVDQLHLAITPTLLGGGERLFEGDDAAGLDVVAVHPSPAVTHVRLARRPVQDGSVHSRH
jgi:dihydrofolate reductase